MSPVCAEGGGMECKGDRRAGHPKPRLCYEKGMERCDRRRSLLAERDTVKIETLQLISLWLKGAV